jgi:hypothetical protein
MNQRVSLGKLPGIVAHRIEFHAFFKIQGNDKGFQNRRVCLDAANESLDFGIRVGLRPDGSCRHQEN